MRKEIPLLLTVATALVVILNSYFFAVKATKVENTVDAWYQITYAMAYGLGIISMTALHLNHIRRRRSTWVYSVILLVLMYGYAILGLIETTKGVHVKWVYDNIVVPADSTMYSLTAFMITSAAYRAFRVRTREATVLMLAAVVVMLGIAPIGDVLISGWGSVSNWLNDVPVTSGYRGISIGIFLGSFAVALRILLGLERAHLGGANQ